ncbi:MAG: hypothetical protein L6M37_03805 [Candidatus Methylarchaceae archaeon HK02M1]|nr:hypothetical protein [Candidatus Methylarchaceae archaeon HK02M1]
MMNFDELFDELQKRSNLDRSALLKLIEEKKRKVGAGYLTDRGAIFLVASDLSVSLDQVGTSDLTIKNLYIGANEITIVARVLSVYPIRTYMRRDGSQGYYSRMILFDGDDFTRSVLWDEKANLIETLNINPDIVVRVAKGYVKAGLDGRPVLHVGSRGNIEVIDDEKLISKFLTVDEITKDVSGIKSPTSFVSVRGSVVTEPKLSEFIRKDGGQGSVVLFYMNDIEDDETHRVAIWDSESELISRLKPGSIVRLINVKAKMTSYGEIELHGDAGTFLEVISKEIVPKASPMIFRLLSIGPKQEERRISALLVDSKKRFYTLMARGDACDKILSIEPGNLITCYPKEIIDSKIVCDDDKSIIPKTLDDAIYLKSQSLFLKVKEISNVDTPVFLEAIALSHVRIKDVATKDSLIVKRAEIMIGDETGEIKIIAWRDLTRLFEGISSGDRLRIGGVVPQMSGTELTLLIRPYSSIEKIFR